MHKCLKCGRKIIDVAEIADGCGCGSKVFVFIKGEDSPSMAHGSNLAVIDFKAPKQGASEPAPAKPDDIAAPEIAPATAEYAGPGAFAAKPATAADAASNPATLANAPSGAPNPAIAANFPNGNADAAPTGHESHGDAPSDAAPHDEVWLAKGGSIKPISESGIENIRQVAKGVFELDVGALGAGPLVVRDENGIYYVRLPFSQGTQSEDQIQ